MEKKNEDWTDIARTGTFTAGNGQTVTLTGEDLDRIVTGFDERERRVPLVFGHPKTSAPAYMAGWSRSDAWATCCRPVLSRFTRT